MDLKELEQFFYIARSKTYAADGKKMKALLSGSDQFEYKDGDWLYRDVYYTGKNKFTGLEAIYYKNKPVFSVSYYGNWGKMTEKEIDNILRGALIANYETRSYKHIKWQKDDFKYDCIPDSFSKSINEIGGYESIAKNGEEIYKFYYGGSILI